MWPVPPTASIRAHLPIPCNTPRLALTPSPLPPLHPFPPPLARRPGQDHHRHQQQPGALPAREPLLQQPGGGQGMGRVALTKQFKGVVGWRPPAVRNASGRAASPRCRTHTPSFALRLRDPSQTFGQTRNALPMSPTLSPRPGGRQVRGEAGPHAGLQGLRVRGAVRGDFGLWGPGARGLHLFMPPSQKGRQGAT